MAMISLIARSEKRHRSEVVVLQNDVYEFVLRCFVRGNVNNWSGKGAHCDISFASCVTFIFISVFMLVNLYM